MDTRTELIHVLSSMCAEKLHEGLLEYRRIAARPKLPFENATFMLYSLRAHVPNSGLATLGTLFWRCPGWKLGTIRKAPTMRMGR